MKCSVATSVAPIGVPVNHAYHQLHPPPRPEHCLPTLFPYLTGADPVAVILSWVGVGVAIYVLVVGLMAIARRMPPRQLAGDQRSGTWPNYAAAVPPVAPRPRSHR